MYLYMVLYTEVNGKKRKYKVLDTFAGAGGFSLGFHLTGKYDIIGAIESDQWAADTFAKEFVKKKGLKLIEYFHNYDKYGKGEPLERNKLIVDECDWVLAFWNGTSRGTKFTLDYAKEKNKPIKIIQI